MNSFFAMVGITGTCMVLPMLQARMGWIAVGLVFTVIAAIVMLPLLVTHKVVK